MTLLLAAVSETLSVQLTVDDEEKNRLIDLMNTLQKRLKYGLSSTSVIAFYEIGFAERVVAQAIDGAILNDATSTANARDLLKEWSQEVVPVIEQFPAYFQSVFTSLVV